VPEDSRPPASTYIRSQPSHKGKEKEMGSGQRKTKLDWALDLVETQRGAERWEEKERVILVVGSELPA
jgi:hypothetical protein